MISKINAIMSEVQLIKDDMVKFVERENSKAGTRARVGLQKIKVMAQEIRLIIQDAKKK